MSFAYFAHIPHSSKFTRGSSLLVEKYLLMEISKAEESSWLKKKPKKQQQQQQQTGPERKERIPFFQEKKKNFGKSNCNWRSSTLAS